MRPGIVVDTSVGTIPSRTRFPFPAFPDDWFQVAYTHDVASGAVRSTFLEQIRQDIPIWENEVHRAEPHLASGEGAVTDFRRWAEQAYPVCAGTGA